MPEIDPELFDNDDFNKGVNFAMDVLASRLGSPEFYASDGSEDYETDLGDTMLNAFAAAGLYDKEEGRFARDVTPRVRRLIIAAREVAFDEHPTKEALKELDRASSAFAEDVPWDDEPMTVEAEPLA